MDNRYGLLRQCSGVWRALRDGDFEEEDVWEVLKERNNARHLPTAARMIPKPSSHNYASGSSCSSSNTTNHEAKIVQQSAPVNIPDWSKLYGQKPNKASKNVSWRKYEGGDDDDEGRDDGGRDSSDDYEVEEEEEEEEEEYDPKEPPHEFIARRLARSQISSFSVCEGAGRTLKGRDLSKVRNAVLSKTGFLESL
ncbi:nucleolin-like [Pyrus x bretschneideri]|uniref:nucleolin-like n=1 Tax=Pyrus x bretschneideri TaxID=225117 RepID=UPI00202E0E5B|nr:nucleolin-like [Pyrus x bretschneideri]